MLLSLSFSVLLSVVPAVEAERVARQFVDALRRDDLDAVKGTARIINPLGYARDMLRLHDQVEVEWWQVASVERRDESTFVVVEVEATALATATRRRVPWPRWWSIEVRSAAAGSELVSVMTLERRLGAQYGAAGSEELSALVRARPELDVERFIYYLGAGAMLEEAAGCEAILWMLAEARARGLVAMEAHAYQMLTFLAERPATRDVREMVTTAEEALRLAVIDGRPDTLADAYHMAGVAYRHAERLDDAVRMLRRSASYFEELDDPRVAMLSQHYVVQIEMARNHLREALAEAERHEVMLERFSTPRNRKETAAQLADIHERLGNVEISRRYTETVRKIAHTMGDHAAEATAMLHLAAHAPDARRLLEEAYAVGRDALPDQGAQIQMALADLQLAEGDPAAAESTLAEALAGAQRAGSEKTTAAVYAKRSALRLLEGRREDALADARAARELAAAAPDKAGNPLADALAAEARALRALSRHDAAEAAWRAAVDVVELDLAERWLDETGSAAVLKTKVTPYRELLDLLVEQGCVREALAVAERMRARSLRNALRHQHIDPAAGLDPAERARERELERTMAEVNRKLLGTRDPAAAEHLRRARDEARLALRRFRSEMHASHPDHVHGWRRSAEQQETLPLTVAPDEVVLELAVNDDAVFLFVLRGADVSIRRIPIARPVLEARVTAFVASLEQRDLAYRRDARALYDLLLAPAAAQLSAAPNVRIVPDGVLWRLPFHALIDSQGAHLAERAVVSYSPSLALTRRCSTISPGRESLLALGDPTVGTETAAATRSLYRDVTLGRLPEAAAEARTIARLYERATVRIGNEARESLFKDEAPAFRVLHLAAHSIVDDTAPMFSSIVLAASGTNPLEDGLLEAREIADLRLGADLAVLSACETARGAVTPGEGMLGLSWAFLAAGVPTTVVSQWKVGSASTAELMIDFHRELREGTKPAQALRTAMLALRGDPRWQHPFYWAPFVVIENSSALTEPPSFAP